MTRCDRVLIIKMSAIGDVVHTLPFLEVIRGNHPHARIDWLVEETTADLIAGHSAIDNILVSRRRSWPRELARAATAPTAIADIMQFIGRLRRTPYDVAIDLQGLLKSGLWLGMARARRKIGLEGAREGSRWFTREAPVPVNYDRHAIDRYLDVAAHLGCRPIPWQGAVPVDRADHRSAEKLIASLTRTGRPIVAINPMARWQSKLWMPERFAALADALAIDSGCQVVFTGSLNDRAAIQDIRRQMKTPAVNLAGRTRLKVLAALLARVSLLVCTDTGPMHIASAMKCRVVALFGPTAPWKTGPYGTGHRVIQPAITCSPCYKKTCQDCHCMQEITVAQVATAVREILLIPCPG